MIIAVMQESDIRDYIRQKRLSKNISLNNFAIENKIDPATLSRVENKVRDLKYSVLEKVAKGFSMTPGEFLLEYESYVRNNQ